MEVLRYLYTVHERTEKLNAYQIRAPDCRIRSFSSEKVLYFFSPYLTYADECHHAVADSYKKIIEYFQPEFLLGLAVFLKRFISGIEIIVNLEFWHILK